MATGSKPDNVFYGLYDKYVGEPETKPEVYGYWLLLVGLGGVLGGVGLWLLGQGTREWAALLGASGTVVVLLGLVLQLPLRKRGIDVAVGSALCSLTMVGVFGQLYPDAWAVGESILSLLAAVGYLGGVTMIVLVGALVPILTGRKSLLLAEESVEPLAWTVEQAEEEPEENTSAVMLGEASRDGVFAVFPTTTGWGWRYVEQTAVADGHHGFESRTAAETALDDIKTKVETAGMLELTHATIRLYRGDEQARWALVDDNGVVLAESGSSYEDFGTAEDAVHLLKEHAPGAALLDVEEGAFEVYGDGSAWRWRLVDGNRGVLGTGSTKHGSRAGAESAVVTVREAIQSAPVMGVEHLGFEFVASEDGWYWKLVDGRDTTIGRASGTYDSQDDVTEAVGRVADSAIDMPFLTATAPGYEIVETETGGWRWRLVDGDDEIVATSEEAVPSAESGRSVVRRIKEVVRGASVGVLEDAEYELYLDGDDWAWRLVTEDRQILARSPPERVYETADAAEAAVDRVCSEIEGADRMEFDSAAFHLYESTDGTWNWRLVDSDGQVVSDSGQEHASRDDAASAMSTMKEHAPEADLVEIDSAALECYQVEGTWHWRLVDAAGETLAVGPGRHDTSDGAHDAMDTLELLASEAGVRRMDAGWFQVSVSDGEPRQWHWQLVHPDGNVLATSVASYPGQDEALAAAEAVTEYAADATVHTISELAIRFAVDDSERATEVDPPERWHWELIDRDRTPLAVGTEQFPSRDAVAATARLIRDHAGAASVFEVDPAAFRLEAVDQTAGEGWRWRLVDPDRTTLAVGSRIHESRNRATEEIARVQDLAGGAGLLDFDLAAFELIQQDGGWRWQFVDTAGTVLGESGPVFDSKPAAERALGDVRDILTTASLIEIESPAFELHSGKGGWRWRFVDTDGSTIAESMRQYPTRREAREAIEGLREFGTDAATELPT